MIDPNRCDHCRRESVRLRVTEWPDRSSDRSAPPAWVVCSWACLLVLAEERAGHPALRPT